MADYAIHEETLEAIADAIRKNDGSSALIDPADFAERIGLMGMLPKGKASGAIAHITDGADDVPCASCKVDITPTLTGVSSVSVVRTGKNLLNDSIRGNNGANIFFNHDTGIQNDFSLRLKKGTYTFSVVTADGTTTNLYVKDSDTNTNITGFPAYGSLSKTFTLDADTNCAVFVYKSGYTDVTDIVSAQIEVGSTASAYEAFVTPTTYTASLGRTVYGGSADIVNGTGTEEYGYFTADGSEDWQAGTNYYYISGAEAPQNPSVADDTGVSNYGALVSSASMDGIFIINNLLQICGSAASAFSDVNDLKAKLAITPLEVSYKLATPTDFTFDGVEVPTRLGVNNFFSNLGDTSVEYRKDIGLAIGLNKYRYLKWVITATRTTSSYCQMSDIEFSDANNNKFTFPTGTTVTADTTATSGTGTAYIIDNNTSTKFCGNWKTGGITITIDLGIGNTIDVTQYKKFSWYTANDANDRDPITWELYGIDVSNSPVLLCSRTAYTPTTDRKALADTVNITSV